MIKNKDRNIINFEEIFKVVIPKENLIVINFKEKEI